MSLVLSAKKVLKEGPSTKVKEVAGMFVDKITLYFKKVKQGRRTMNVLDYGVAAMVSLAGVASECYSGEDRGDWTVFELNFQEYLKVFTSQSIHLIRFVELMADAG